MKNLYNIDTQGFFFFITLKKRCAKDIYAFAQHLEFALKKFKVDVKSVSRDNMMIRGMSIEDTGIFIEDAIAKEIKYYFKK